MISEQWSDDAKAALSSYDPIDLAAGMGGLQVVPANAGRLYGLGIAAAIVAELEPVAGLPAMSSASWRNLLNGTGAPLHVGVGFEQPYESPFVDEFTWDGAAYRFLPGLEDESTYVLRRITDAISLLGASANSRLDFVEQARRTGHAALSVADAVCRRAGLSRGCEPGTSVGAAVQVPSGQHFSDLKSVVQFRLDEIKAVLAARDVGLDHLAPFIASLGPAFPVAYGITMMPALGAPIIRHANDLVVIGPQTIITLLRHALIRLAMDYGAVDALASAYRAAVFASVTRSMRFLGSDPLDLPLLADAEEAATLSGFYRLDDDKAVHAIIVTDDLRDYSRDDPLGVWPLSGVPEIVEERLANAEAFAFANITGLRQLLHLVLIQGIGRLALAAFVPSFASDRSQGVLMSAGDLCTIALAEGGTQLRLWQFACALSRYKESTNVVQLSALDVFDAWRSREFSFYLDDDARLDVAFVGPGGAGHLRRETRKKLDWHGVHDVAGGITEVVRLHRDPMVPVYVPWNDFGGPIRLLTEATSGLYWITGPNEVVDARYWRIYADIADMLAYWLWQMDPGLAQLDLNVGSQDRPLIIRLELEAAEVWFSASAEPDDGEPVRCTVMGEHELLLHFGPRSVRLLESADNAGERHILKILLDGVARLAAAKPDAEGTKLSSAEIDSLVDQFAPLGRKKKFFFISQSADRRLDDRFLPSFREVQGPDEEELLDLVGEFVINGLGLEPGPISEDQWTRVLREVVAFLFRELERLVAALSPDGLLERLVAANEAILYHQAKRQLTIPTQLACFGSAGSMIEQLRRKLPEASKAATASRALIEYVTAQPPNGAQPLSLATYDRLLATVSDLQEWAFISDDIHFGLSGHDLDVLPSRRLGVGREKFVAARELFLGALAIGEIGRSEEAFGHHWSRTSDADYSRDPERDAATAAEFGLPVSKLIEFLGALFDIGDAQESAAKVVAQDALLMQLTSDLGWSAEAVHVAFNLFAAFPWAAFDPPPPFAAKDTWPWNFNRALSYLRKPLLVRNRGDRLEVVWGNRNLFLAGHHLLDLCANGRLKPRSPEMRRFIGERRNAHARAFNDRVADAFEAVPGLVVRRRVKKFDRLQIRRANNEDLGDVDVLVVDASARRILAIETKELAAARTPAELHNELEAVFEADNNRSADIDRHLERVQWLRDNLAAVLRAFHLDDKESGWIVEPLIVAAVESLAPLLRGQRIRVASVHEILRELESQTT